MLKQGNNLNSSQYLISAKRKFTKTDPFQNDSRGFLYPRPPGKVDDQVQWWRWSYCNIFWWRWNWKHKSFSTNLIVRQGNSKSNGSIGRWLGKLWSSHWHTSAWDEIRCQSVSYFMVGTRWSSIRSFLTLEWEPKTNWLIISGERCLIGVVISYKMIGYPAWSKQCVLLLWISWIQYRIFCPQMKVTSLLSRKSVLQLDQPMPTLMKSYYLKWSRI